MTESDVQRVDGDRRVEQLDRGQRERGQRLVEREVVLQVDGEPDQAALLVRLVEPLDHPAGQQRPVDRDGPADVPALRGRSSWLSVSRCRIAANASPGRLITLSSIAWLTAKLDCSGSGSAATSRSNVGSPQATKPSGGFLRTTLRRFFGSSPALASAFSFSTTCSGACTTTVPAVSKPARPARPAIWWNSRAWSSRVLVPVVLGQRGEQHGADRHVDADAEGVGAADDLQQAGLGQRSPPAGGTSAASRRGARRCRAAPAGTASCRTRR